MDVLVVALPPASFCSSLSFELDRERDLDLDALLRPLVAALLRPVEDEECLLPGLPEVDLDLEDDADAALGAPGASSWKTGVRTGFERETMDAQTCVKAATGLCEWIKVTSVVRNLSQDYHSVLLISHG